ncbi:MAG: AP2 domain-containing protein, partial [Planctomycetota bacterium]
GLMVDHINHNGLDNRKVNLRVATRAQNSRNIRKSQNKFSSNYKGVHFRRREGLWMARITVDGRTLYLGDFKEEVDAARAHDRAAMKYHREFAALNFEQ